MLGILIDPQAGVSGTTRVISWDECLLLSKWWLSCSELESISCCLFQFQITQGILSYQNHLICAWLFTRTWSFAISHPNFHLPVSLLHYFILDPFTILIYFYYSAKNKTHLLEDISSRKRFILTIVFILQKSFFILEIAFF